MPVGSRLARFEQIGVDVVVICTFDHAFSEITREEFLADVILDKLNASHVVVGHDFAFGKGRGGTTDWLASQIHTTVIPKYMLEGRRVSSSEIRGDIEEGKVAEAAVLLGEPFALTGIVVPGNGLGRKWEMPTANIALPVEMLVPKIGIYAGWAVTPFGPYAAAISVGNRPTIPGAGFAIEAFLLEYPGQDLYGRAISLSFVSRIRDEATFSTETELVDQMRLDVAKTREAVSAYV
jgi:riboflavin kinase/FMN adenylyltransferase